MYNFDEVINRENTGSGKWNEVSDGNAKEKRYPPLTTADMEFKTCPAILRALQNRIEHGIFGYTKPDERLYHAVSSYILERHGFRVEEQSLIYSTSVVPAIMAGIKSCTKEGEGVILLSPVYTAFYSSIEKTKRKLVDCPLERNKDRYEINFDLLEELAKEEQNRLLILCSPHNPVGRVWTYQELKQIIEICKKYDIYLLSDEIHWDLILEGEHVSIGAFKEVYPERIILCSAPTKTFNLAGSLIAYTIIFDDKLRKIFKEKLKEAGHLEAISVFGYEATIAAYENGGAWLLELLSYLRENFDYFRKWLLENEPDISMIKTEGTYLAWLDCRNIKPNFDLWYQKKLEHGIFLTDGSYFGEQGKGFVRVNLALPREELKKVLEHWKCDEK